MDTLPVRLTELGPDDPAFAAWSAVWAASEAVDRPDDAPRPAAEDVALARRLAEPGGSRTGTHRTAVLGDEVVGALRLILPLQDNTAVALVDLAVHPAHRGRGIGSLLLSAAGDLAAAEGRTTLLTEIDEPAPDGAGRRFALRHGWTCDIVETRFDLLLPPDEARLSALEDQARTAAHAYEVLTWRDRTPDALLDDRALLSRRMSTDAPHGDMPVEEEQWDGERIREKEELDVARGRAVLSAGAVRDGRLVAFTELHVPLSDPGHARQGATLVLREHRGHRLGALVKAAVLRDLARAFPQTRRITTYNAAGNAPMVAVNEALGFRPAGHFSSWSVRLPSGGAAG